MALRRVQREKLVFLVVWLLGGLVNTQLPDFDVDGSNWDGVGHEVYDYKAGLPAEVAGEGGYDYGSPDDGFWNVQDGEEDEELSRSSFHHMHVFPEDVEPDSDPYTLSEGHDELEDIEEELEDMEEELENLDGEESLEEGMVEVEQPVEQEEPVDWEESSEEEMVEVEQPVEQEEPVDWEESSEEEMVEVEQPVEQEEPVDWEESSEEEEPGGRPVNSRGAAGEAPAYSSRGAAGEAPAYSSRGAAGEAPAYSSRGAAYSQCTED
ncbi:pharyngeal muscle protein 2-like [Amia ocellicauda]|uniref:pharyngeal muscle protein 2-like n=1 Tax=Amia ocellicauda TaxID=2972642 RepID=UPI0034642A17